MKSRVLKISVMCFVSLAVTFTSVAGNCAVWYVDAGAPSGGDGKSWVTAFRDIQSAINAASSGWVPCFAPFDQIWVKEGTYNLTSQINVNRVVSIYGGFAGGETAVSQRDWKNNPTFVDGQDSVRCFYLTAPAEINGFTIRNGRHAVSGGGIYIDSTPVYCADRDSYHTPRIRNCAIVYSTANAVGGGGIYDWQSSVDIRNCVFLLNSGATGGAIFATNSCPSIEQSVFRWNNSTAIEGDLYGGAAVHMLHVCYDPPNCPEPVECPAKITNSLFHANMAQSNGGAISLHGVSDLIVLNCTFTKNKADKGGAVLVLNAWPHFRNCIFWDDTPDEIYSYDGYSSPRVSHSDVEGGYTGPGSSNIDEDPLFVSALNQRLSPGSPCIDAGSNINAPSVDLEGVSRPQDGDGDGQAVVDMGAYEFPEPLPPCEGDLDGDNDVDGTDLAVFAADFGRTDCGSGCDGDFDGDGDVDGSDLATFAADFGRTDCLE